jgi:hypothetical protein
MTSAGILHHFFNYRTRPKGKGKFELPEILVTNRPMYSPDLSTRELFGPATTMIASSQRLPTIRAIRGHLKLQQLY